MKRNPAADDLFGEPLVPGPGMPCLFVLVDWTKGGQPRRSRCPVNPVAMLADGYDPADPESTGRYISDIWHAGAVNLDCAVRSVVIDPDQGDGLARA